MRKLPITLTQLFASRHGRISQTRQNMPACRPTQHQATVLSLLLHAHACLLMQPEHMFQSSHCVGQTPKLCNHTLVLMTCVLPAAFSNAVSRG